MSNYFDNQDKWSWHISDHEVLVTTDHGDHTHTLDVTDVPVGDMADHTGQVMGDAHRAASHDYKEEAELQEETPEQEVTEEETSVIDDGEENEEDCEDDLEP